jgi:hypothetical protein
MTNLLQFTSILGWESVAQEAMFEGKKPEFDNLMRLSL